MQKLKFTSITEENRNVFHRLMQMYAKELDEHQNRNTDSELLKRWTDSIIEKQFDFAKCLKLCYAESAVIGFLFGKIDQPEDKGFKKVGFGCIMEFFVLPEHRKNGYGRQMFGHLVDFFKANQVKQMYLTADPVTGKPFWEALGFNRTGEISPENGQEVYEKAIPDETISITVSEFLSTTAFKVVEAISKEDARYVADIYGKNIEALHGNEIMFDEWYGLLSSDDSDEKHFLILKGAIPCAYLKINGLDSQRVGWISMLAVEPAFHRNGVGEYAVQYAEEFLRNMGKSVVCIHTTEDNIPAQRLYEKCGYVISERCELTTGDGVKRTGYTFSKQII